MNQPAHFGPYEVVAPLNAGAMGSVYRARHTATGREVAVKTVREIGHRNLLSLRREIEALGRVEHPNVVSILDHGVEGGLPWCAVELIEGGDLSERLAQIWPAERPENPRAANGFLAEVLKILQNLCEPLAYIHGMGLVHGDLKPANVLLDGRGNPRLLDFGLAERGAPGLGRESMRVGGTGSGTMAYISPERIRGEVIDARADLYALGCMAYEMLTGLLPLQKVNEAPDPYRRLKAEVPPPSTLVEGVSPELDALVLGLLARDRRDRPGHASDVAHRLSQISGNTLVRRGPAPASYLYWPRFVGRQEPLDQLTDLLFGQEDGQSGAAFVVGESGVGKTRLVGEVATSAVLQGRRLVHAECALLRPGEGGSAAPLTAFRPLLELIHDEALERGLAWSEAVLGDEGRVLAAYDPRLAALPGQKERPEPPILSPQASRERAREAFLAVLRRFAGAGEPLVLVLEDIQWADELSLELLAAQLRKSEGPPLLVLGTVRSDELESRVDRILEIPGVLRLRLERMDAPLVRSMVSDMLAVPEPPAELVDVLLEQSEGNPFFLTESLRVAVDGGLLHRDDAGHWRIFDTDLVSAKVRDLAPPGSLVELVTRRLGLLSPSARSCAETASVLGLVVSEELLIAALEGDSSQARAAITELVRRQVMEPEFGGRLRFTHGKLRELGYAALEEGPRSSYHRRAAGAYEAIYPDQSERNRHAAELAQHWRMAGERARAVGYLDVAGEAAFSAAAYEGAVAFFRQAIELGEPTPGLATARWHNRLGEALFALGETPASEEQAREALALLSFEAPNGNPGWGFVLVRELLSLLWRRVVPARPAPPERAPWLRESARAANQLGLLKYFQEAPLAMVALNLRSINEAERCGPEVANARYYASLAYLAGISRLPGVSRGLFERAAAQARLQADPGGLASTRYQEALLRISLAEWDAAWPPALEAEQLTQSIQDGQEIEVAQTILLHIELYTGRVHASLRRCERLARIARERKNQQHESWGFYAAARCLLVMEDYARAAADAEQGELLLRGVRDSASSLMIQGIWARALLALGRADEARQQALRGMTLLDAGVASVASIVDGFVGLAIAFHGLSLPVGAPGLAGPPSPGGDAAALAQLKRCVKLMGVNGMTYPLFQPATLFATGLLRHAEGKPAAAIKALNQSYEAAERRGMWSDAVLAARAANRLGLSGEAAEAWRRREAAALGHLDSPEQAA